MRNLFGAIPYRTFLLLLSEYVYRMAEVAFYQAYRMRYGLYVPKYLNDILTW